MRRYLTMDKNKWLLQSKAFNYIILEYSSDWQDTVPSSTILTLHSFGKLKEKYLLVWGHAPWPGITVNGFSWKQQMLMSGTLQFFVISLFLCSLSDRHLLWARNKAAHAGSGRPRYLWVFNPLRPCTDDYQTIVFHR